MGADCARKANDRRSVSGAAIICAGAYVFFATQMSGACGQRGVENNNVRSAEQHADFLTKPLHTEAFSFHRTCDEHVVISYVR